MELLKELVPGCSKVSLSSSLPLSFSPGTFILPISTSISYTVRCNKLRHGVPCKFYFLACEKYSTPLSWHSVVFLLLLR
jgi:hypothetical protein